MRILILDDEPAVAENIRFYLEECGHTVRGESYVPNRSALESVLRIFRPHGAIVDFEMHPRGDKLAGWLYELQPLVPVVFYTKHAHSAQHRSQMDDATGGRGRIVQKVSVRRDVPLLLDALGAPVE